MRVLIIHATPWNDNLYGNNVLTNWFDGMDVELANIYRGEGRPSNKCCKKYFQLTDRMMVNSIVHRVKAGKTFVLDDQEVEENLNSVREIQRLKKFSNEFTQLCRSIVWMSASIDEIALKKFIEDFDPDVVFTCRKASLATLRVERFVHKYTETPFIAFTGDDEYSLKQLRFSPFFWIDRFAVRKSLRKNAKFYGRYLTLSETQASEYKEIFNIDTGVLRKCGEGDLYNPDKECHFPIRILYAGKLYCNRWKTLLHLAEAIDRINQGKGCKIFQLAIYAVDSVPHELQEFCKHSDNTEIHAAVPGSQLPKLFSESDIVLHVESFDLRNRLDTRLSFSTKIIDCLASGCAIMAICWEEQAGYKYLKDNELALCASTKEEIYGVLQTVAENREILSEYAQRANSALLNKHNKNLVQKELLDVFENSKIGGCKQCVAQKQFSSR